jgi:opacity protein-like surface antigen
MKKLTTILVILCSVFSLKAQNSPTNFRLGITASIDKNLSSESMAFDQYTGYSADYDKINYRLGLNLEYQLKQNLSINTAIQYSNKDFTGTYFCAVCVFSVPPSPEDIDFRFIEVPLSMRYYFLPDKLGLFGEVGINNQFLLNEELTDKSYALGIKLGAGLEYGFTQTLALQFLVDYNRGVTNLYNESDFKINYLGFGVGIMKKI